MGCTSRCHREAANVQRVLFSQHAPVYDVRRKPKVVNPIPLNPELPNPLALKPVASLCRQSVPSNKFKPNVPPGEGCAPRYVVIFQY